MIHTDVQSAVRSLRGCFTDLLTSVGGDPRRPQELSRRFGVDKTLAWKISRVIGATETEAALEHMPGEAAFDILLSALQRAGVRPAEIVRARSVLKSYRDAIEHRVGDRSTLEIVVDALPSQKRDRLALSRKLAFRGNSGIWGVQARVRVNTVILKPNAIDPQQVDSILIGGWVDFRRMRPDVQWTLFRRRSFRRHAQATHDVPIDPDEPVNGPMLLRRFCSGSMPQIHAVDGGEAGVAYELGPGPVGNSGMFTCFFGSLHERLGPRVAEGPSEQADFYAMISAPVETLLFDLIAHESLSIAHHASVSVHGVLTNTPGVVAGKNQLPVEPQTHEIGGHPPMLTTPLVPEYADVIDHTFRQVGWDAREFVGQRFTLDHPPFPSTVVVSFPLEAKPTHTPDAG